MTFKEESTGLYFTFFPNSFIDDTVVVEVESDDIEGLNGWAKVDVVTTWEKFEGDGLTEPRYGSWKVRLDILEIKMWMGDKPINVLPEHEQLFKDAINDYYL